MARPGDELVDPDGLLLVFVETAGSSDGAAIVLDFFAPPPAASCRRRTCTFRRAHRAARDDREEPRLHGVRRAEPRRAGRRARA